jgi:hypothetical protein|uniref:Uncharacterized protein n=2 Tax=Picea TaxID=3328 RepID=A0A101LXD0_PICGL|nr:hypothetical protein ABT39_MTgene6095 [Picea glauca]QHR89941.1 hypothetical protein Q903MT_gene3963 [Picea sitchensis]
MALLRRVVLLELVLLSLGQLLMTKLQLGKQPLRVLSLGGKLPLQLGNLLTLELLFNLDLELVKPLLLAPLLLGKPPGMEPGTPLVNL